MHSVNPIPYGFTDGGEEDFLFIANWATTGFAVKGVSLNLENLLKNEDVLKMFASTLSFRNYESYVNFILKHFLGYTAMTFSADILKKAQKIKKELKGKEYSFFSEMFENEDFWFTGENQEKISWDNISEVTKF